MSHPRAIISFMGFKNSPKKRNGFEDGYFKHLVNYGCGGTLTFAPRTWKTDVSVLANQLSRQKVKRVAILSYSHGQAAAVAFADYAYEIGLHVDLWIACDPVQRPKWLPRWTIAQFFAIRSLATKGKIKVPRNIKRAVYVRQEKDKPQGHTLVATHPKQHVECKRVLYSLGHTQIDESDAYWDLVNDELEVWTNPPKAVMIEGL